MFRRPPDPASLTISAGPGDDTRRYEILVAVGALPRVGEALATIDGRDWIVEGVVWATHPARGARPHLVLRPLD